MCIRDSSFALTIPNKVVVVGIVAEGLVRPGMKLVVNRRDSESEIPVSVYGLEEGRTPLRYAKAGDRVAIILTGATKDDVGPGDELTYSDDDSRTLLQAFWRLFGVTE